MGFRYLGVKGRVIDHLMLIIRQVIGDSGHVTDLMCGTATVTSALREHGYRVTANDLMTYSYHHACVALLFSEPPNFNQADEFLNRYDTNEISTIFVPSRYERMLNALSNVEQIRGYFYNEFSPEGSPANLGAPRNYFSAENAMIIDGVRYWIRNLYQEHRISDLEHSLLLHNLIMAANDIANIAGTYGHYMSKLDGRANERFRLKPLPIAIMNDAGKHKVLQGYAERIAAQIECDLCYIDPPYTKRQYAANYHILETLAREDEPEAIGVSGLRPWRDQYSNFCTKTKIRDSFRAIFSTMKCNHFIVSYSEDGLLKLDELEDLFTEFGEIEITAFQHKRFRSNDSSLATELTEYLIHLHIC